LSSWACAITLSATRGHRRQIAAGPGRSELRALDARIELHQHLPLLHHRAGLEADLVHAPGGVVAEVDALGARDGPDRRKRAFPVLRARERGANRFRRRAHRLHLLAHRHQRRDLEKLDGDERGHHRQKAEDDDQVTQ
jgi:hypothetical protein